MGSILFLVAHPDDVANGMGGTALLLKDHYDLHVLCATRGERGKPEWTMEKTAAVREKEERAASAHINAKLHFLDRIDAEVFADAEICQRVAGFITDLQPVALFTLWAIDCHPDHSAVSEIARKAVHIAGTPIDIAYGEEGDSQTDLFSPDLYVDISSAIEGKLDMIRCHPCQNDDDKMAQHFLKKAVRRGADCGCDHAEAYRLHAHKKNLDTHVLKSLPVSRGPSRSESAQG